MQRFCLLAILISWVFSEAIAEEPKGGAPFGLTWGMTISELRKQKIKITEETPLYHSLLVAVGIKEAPITPDDTEKFLLAFGKERGLQQVIWYGKPINNDALGTEGKEKFRSLRTLLSKKYGEPTKSTEKNGLLLWGCPERFYELLKSEGEGFWYNLRYETVWRAEWQLPEGIELILKLEGLEPKSGRVVVRYLTPKWFEIIELEESARTNALLHAF